MMRALMTIEPVRGRDWIPRGKTFEPISAQERLDLLAAGRAEDAPADDAEAPAPARPKSAKRPRA